MIKRCLKTIIGWNRMTERDRYLSSYRLASLIGRATALLPIPLWWLLREFGSDKHMPGWHSYGTTYGRLFRPWKYRRLRLLEIGIGGYATYLGGRSTFVGADRA